MMSYLAAIDFQNMAFLLLGGCLGCGLFYWLAQSSRKNQESQAGNIVEKARKDAEGILRDARLAVNEESLKIRQEIERDASVRNQERMESDRRMSERETMINGQLDKLLQSEKNLQQQKTALDQQSKHLAELQEDLDHLIRQRREQLQKLAFLSEAEAKAQFLKEIENESIQDAAKISRHILDDARNKAEERARFIISTAIQRYAGEHTFETTTATIALQGDDIKGRIIGRDGRNIRSFEAATGITVLIDDTPNAVVLSGFDPVRREIAKESMTRLILDGRIHPARIEEVVAKVTQEMDETVQRLGEEAVLKTGIAPINGDIVTLLGKLHFRHSYSQNVLDHSQEVAHLMGLMASELGLDVSTAKRAGLLHDIGKAMSHEVEGPHALVGADFIKRYGEVDPVVNAVASHHNEVPPVGPLGILVSAADAISASRPGARSETMTTYLKRIADLEKIALSFPGVEKCFAVQAGRELRVMVPAGFCGDAFVSRDGWCSVSNTACFCGRLPQACWPVW